MMDKILERLLKGDGSKGLSITKVFENIGREKRYRYFACKKAVDHFKDEAISRDAEKTSKDKRGSKSAIHLSSLQRRNNLLELLDTHKVLECGHALMDSYENLMEERGTQTGYRIDRKTLDRTAKSLQDDQLLSMHVIRIPQMAGSVLSKTILLHKSLTIKSPIVQDFIESIQMRLSQSSTSQKRILENVELERLDSRKKKKRVTQKPAAAEGTLIDDAPVYRGDHDPNLIEFPFPAQESEEETENQNSNNWIACLLKHGYVQSVIPRSRILHAWLFQKLTKQSDKENFAYENDGWFSLSIILNDLDFGLYMKLVGLINEPPSLTEFLAQGNYSNYTTGNLPPPVREAIFSRGYVRYRREIRNIMNELERLKVISPGDNQKQGDTNLWTKYKLNSEIAIPSAGTSFHITDLETLGHFWVKINYSQSKIEMAARQRKSRTKKTKKDDISPTASAPGEAVSLVKEKDYTNPQRSLSVAEIMKLESKEPALLPSVKSRLSSKKEPAKKRENILTMKAINQNDHIKPRQRVQWSSEELLKLFVYYTILSHESRPKKILIWKTIMSKFPHYGESRCKKQVEGAKKDTFLKTQLEWLKKKWEQTIKENFQSGQVNFDLDQFAELLISKIDFEAWYYLFLLILGRQKRVLMTSQIRIIRLTRVLLPRLMRGILKNSSLKSRQIRQGSVIC